MANGGGQFLGPLGAFHIHPDVHSQRLANYRNLLLNAAPTYSGKLEGHTFPEWRATMQLLFESHSVPEDCRRPIAEYFLSGPALLYWAQVKGEYGLNPTLYDLVMRLSHRFLSVTDAQAWGEHARSFRQGLGEEIVPFGIRFEQDLLGTCPYPMPELFMMRLYQECIRPEYRLPRPAVPYGSFQAMRAAHDLIVDEDTLPYAPAPLVPEPVIPAQAPPQAGAPAVPNEPIPAVDPAEGDNSEHDPESPREDTDPTEYSSEQASEDLGENDVVVDWDPAGNLVLEANGVNDDPALAGPIEALDPEDLEMVEGGVNLDDDYFAGLGAP